MLTRAQQILLKRAQAEARLDDADYRDALQTVSGLPGCRSSKDPRLTDRTFDLVLAYFEAIYWRKRDAGEILALGSRSPVFRVRGHWASKNPSGSTSRDRFTEHGLQAAISDLETKLHALGFGLGYCRAIQNRIRPFSLWAYKSALDRTLKSKQAAAAMMPDTDDLPF